MSKWNDKPRRKPPAHCCSSDPCFGKAGYGQFLSFCEKHFQELVAVGASRAERTQIEAANSGKRRDDAQEDVSTRVRAALPRCSEEGCSRPQHSSSHLGTTCYVHRNVGKPVEKRAYCAHTGCRIRSRKDSAYCGRHLPEVSDTFQTHFEQLPTDTLELSQAQEMVG
jgi:hypothetical protein